MKKLNKSGLCLLELLTVAALLPSMLVTSGRLTANANSGPTHWNGVTSSGAVFSGDNCPIEAESEILTFNIPQFIHHGTEKEELLNYEANFSAEYTFKNPTDSEVNATLAFPLGERSDLGYWENGGGGANDTFINLDEVLAAKNMYKVMVDGEKIDARTRYTFHALNDFDFSEESKRLCGGYRSHEFFTPDMPVYKYSFRFVSEEKEFFQAEATIKNTANLRFGGGYGSLSKEKNSTVITYSVRGGEETEIYSIGGELIPEATEWRFYKNTGYFGLAEKSVEAQAVYEPQAAGQTTFKEYVFKGYTGGNGVAESDFYNAVLDYIDEYLETSMLPKNYAFLQDSSYLMRWLVYDLNFSAGQTIKNTVSAPLFSGGQYNYDPYVYNYNYLLSPARKWSGFKSIEIRINTPYYLINSSVQFRKTDYGYVYNQNGLPDGELEFEMCTVENPEHKVNYGYTVFAVVMIVLGAAVILIPLAIIIILIVLLVKRSKKGNANAVKSGVNGFRPMNTFDDGK